MTYFARKRPPLVALDVAGVDPSGARRLAAAVLARAGLDLQTLADALRRPDGKPKAREVDALAWMLDTREGAPWSLRWCCELLEYNAENFRAHAVAMVDRAALRDRLTPTTYAAI